MSELKILTLHIENDKYAYYHVEELNAEIILVHDVPHDDIGNLVHSLENKLERKSDFLIIVDKNKETAFDNLAKISQLSKLIKNMETRSFENDMSLPYIIRNNMPKVYENTTMYDDAFLKPKNPHQNSKSRNCKIRRR